MKNLLNCIIVLTWKIVIVGSNCPSGFTCSGSLCYLIYPTSNNGWEYQDPNGDIINADGNVYESPNCYKYIKVTNTNGACIDAQSECEKVGGSITVLNSIEEYEQLTENVLQILNVGEDSTFSVHVQNLQLDGISKGCATIKIEDELFNDVDIANTECSQTHMIDAIVCESTDVNVEVCLNVSTDGSMQFTPTPELTTTEARTDASTNLVSIVAPIVVITILIIFLGFLFIRHKKRRKQPGNDEPVDKVEYNIEDISSQKNTLDNGVYLNGSTTNDEAVYEEIIDEVEHHGTAVESEYHDTAVKDDYDDTGTAVEVKYHVNADEVVYQNSSVDRSKRNERRKRITNTK